MSFPTDRPWRVEVSPRVKKRIARIPERERILTAILALREGPTAGDTKTLHGRPEWRLRVGRWRVLLRIDREARVIWATAAGPRGDIYK